MDQIFNELSANSCYDSKYSASAGMEKLMGISRELHQLGYSSVLRTTQDFTQRPLAPDYTVHQWATDKTIGADRDLQRWLLTSATQAPYIEQFLDDEQKERLVEFQHNGRECLGLGLAHLWGCGALALDGDAAFTQPRVALTFIQTDAEDEIIEVASIYCQEQLPALAEELSHRFLNAVTCGYDLITYCKELFPCLSFVNAAQEQLYTLTGSEQYFNEIVRHLRILNNTMLEWDSGRFTPKGFLFSLESTSTLRKYEGSRDFVCLDGLTRQFAYHSKMHGANQRIHFYPDLETRIVHIGYVGKHLPTLSDPT